MKALEHMVVPLLVVTLSNHSESERCLFIECLLRIKICEYSHMMIPELYHSEPTIEYIETYEEEFHNHQMISVNCTPLHLERRPWMR